MSLLTQIVLALLGSHSSDPCNGDSIGSISDLLSSWRKQGFLGVLRLHVWTCVPSDLAPNKLWKTV